MTEQFKRGTQIIYVPDHVNGNCYHADCERGFTITDKGESVFCRYFCRLHHLELRTMSCSESTNKRNLIIKNTIDQKIIDNWIIKIEKNPEIYGEIN